MNHHKCGAWVSALNRVGYRAEMVQSDGSSWAVRIYDEDGESALLFDDGPQVGGGPLAHDAYAVVRDVTAWPHDDVWLTPAVLRAWREKLGLSQSQFATALGVEPITVSRWERGDRGFNATLVGLALDALAHKTTNEEMR